MKIRCESNTGRSLPEEFRCNAETSETEFSSLKIGEEYFVYGLMSLKNRIDFLICPDTTGPYWMPANLFTILDPSIPAWKVCATAQTLDYAELFSQFGISLLVGYDALIDDYQHYIGIMERDPLQLQLFYSEKMKIDATYSDESPAGM